MIILAAIFILLNGFFVLSEFCIVKVRRSRLEELVKEKRPNAKLALRMSNSLDTYLSATQLGITLSSLALGWIGEPAVADIIQEPLKSAFGIDSETTLHTISFIIAFSFITLLHVVLGELVPKSVAIAKAEQAALLIARPLYFFWIIFFPVIRTFDFIAAIFLKLIGIRHARESELAHSEEEIKIIVGESLKGGVLDSMESEIIKNAIDFSDTVAKEIMTPRKDVVCLNKKLSFEENMNIITKSKYTRFPYIDGSKDSVLGMIHIRDILQNDLEGRIENLDKIVRKFIIVPENSSISKILVMMNKDRISAALVVDEYGGTAGLLTMEDIIEEIVGDINDEHDDKDQNYKKIADDTYEFNGRFEIESVEEIMGIRFDEETEQLTIGGYVFNLFERLPVVGDTIEDANCLYEVISMDGTSIGSIKVTLLNSKDDDEEEFD